MAALCMATALTVGAQTENVSLRELLEQNRLLREQARAQQRQIDDLSVRVEQLAKEAAHREPEGSEQRRSGPPMPETGSKRVILSGYGSLAFTSAESRGKFAHEEFRIDDARIQIEAQLWQNTYLAGELILTQRETNDENAHLGEYYLDVENLAGNRVADRLINLRLGRFAIPYGEEYQVRLPWQNPLISHSVSDFWGIDEGIEVYGETGRLAYAAAVQNGGVSRLRDFHRDKALVARISWTPAPALNLSASVFRTGKLDRARDTTSEMWIGNAFFRSIGKAPTTRTYQADLGQVDLRWRWQSGSFAGSVGRGRYSDDDTAADNRRSFDFYHLQLVQTLIGKSYAAARYSALSTDKGYYLPGLGSYSEFFLGETLTRKTTRLSLGAGYRFNSALNLKLEYTFEDARRMTGAKRDDEDQFAAELAVKF